MSKKKSKNIIDSSNNKIRNDSAHKSHPSVLYPKWLINYFKNSSVSDELTQAKPY